MQGMFAQPAGMTSKEMGLGAILSSEVWWREHYAWLLENGYKLRPRYDPAWIPSWKGKPPSAALDREDGQAASEPKVLDAIRVSDGVCVVLKRLNNERSPTEVAISMYLNSPKLQSDPRNHCIPIYQVLHSPIQENYSILVIPLLRSFYNPKFDTVGEIVACLRQLFEGLQFMHENLVAHRDACFGNIMMDASDMYPEGWHFTSLDDMNKAFTRKAVHLSRSEVPTPIRYYFIDFGIAVRFESSQTSRLALPVLGADKTAPELQGENEDPIDPFPTDVYYMGNTINRMFFTGLEDIASGYRGLEWLKPLVLDMTQKDPSKRPTMKEVITRFESLISQLSQWKLRSPAVHSDELLIVSLLRSPMRWKRSWDLSKKGFSAIR
jgi:serine/threonine protein kinase